MARAKGNGDGRLEKTTALLNQSMAALNQAMATLAQNQAVFLGRIGETDARIARIEGEITEMNQRFARIEAILIEHGRTLQALPDTIRDKIGFKSPGQKPTE